MLKKKFATAGIALATAASLAACSDSNDVDGTWKAENETLEIQDGRYKMTATDSGEEFSVEGDVDYETQEIIVSSKDVLESLKSEMSEEEAKQVEEQVGDEEKIQRSKYTLDGDTLTIDDNTYTRED